MRVNFKIVCKNFKFVDYSASTFSLYLLNINFNIKTILKIGKNTLVLKNTELGAYVPYVCPGQVHILKTYACSVLFF